MVALAPGVTSMPSPVLLDITLSMTLMLPSVEVMRIPPLAWPLAVTPLASNPMMLLLIVKLVPELTLIP